MVAGIRGQQARHETGRGLSVATAASAARIQAIVIARQARQAAESAQNDAASTLEGGLLGNIARRKTNVESSEYEASCVVIRAGIEGREARGEARNRRCEAVEASCRRIQAGLRGQTTREAINGMKQEEEAREVTTTEEDEEGASDCESFLGEVVTGGKQDMVGDIYCAVRARDVRSGSLRERQAAAVFRIQGGIQGHEARHETQAELSVATAASAARIQAIVIARQARQARHTEAEVLTQPAPEPIQGAIRGATTRHLVRNTEATLVTAASVVMVAGIRGHEARREANQRQEAAVSIQGCVDGSLVRAQHKAITANRANIAMMQMREEYTEAGAQEDMAHQVAIENKVTKPKKAAAAAKEAAADEAQASSSLVAASHELEAGLGSKHERPTARDLGGSRAESSSVTTQGCIVGRQSRLEAASMREEDAGCSGVVMQAALGGQDGRRSQLQEADLSRSKAGACRLEAPITATATRTAVGDASEHAEAVLSIRPVGSPPQQAREESQAGEVVAGAHPSAKASLSPSRAAAGGDSREAGGVLSPAVGSMRRLLQCQEHYTQAENLLIAARRKIDEAAEAASMVQRSLRRLLHLRRCWEEKKPLSRYYRAACLPYERSPEQLDTARDIITQAFQTAEREQEKAAEMRTAQRLGAEGRRQRDAEAREEKKTAAAEAATRAWNEKSEREQAKEVAKQHAMRAAKAYLLPTSDQMHRDKQQEKASGVTVHAASSRPRSPHHAKDHLSHTLHGVFNFRRRPRHHTSHPPTDTSQEPTASLPAASH